LERVKDNAGLVLRIRELAEQMGKAKFARAVNISATQLFRYLNGTNEPRVSILLRMAEAGGTSVEWLATGKGPRSGELHSVRSKIDTELLREIMLRLELLLEQENAVMGVRARAESIATIYLQLLHSELDAPKRQNLVPAFVETLRPMLRSDVHEEQSAG